MEGISELISRSPILITLLVLALLSLIISTTKAQIPYHIDIGNNCINSTEQTLPDRQREIENTLSNLNLQGKSNSFGSNSSNGTNDTLYARYDCRLDVNTSVCQQCVNNSRGEIRRRCPNGVFAVESDDNCILRYSNQDFYGNLTSEPYWYHGGSKNISNPKEVKITKSHMWTLMGRVVDEEKLWYDENFDLSNGEKRYAMVQCSEGLGSMLCAQCLEDMLAKVPECCQQNLEWKVVSPSCLMMYQDIQLPPTAKQGGNNWSRILIYSLISAFVAIVLLSCSIYYFLLQKRVKKEIQPVSTSINFQCNIIQSEKSYEDLPIIPFSAIQESTNNFSEASKLGKGGFGSVYKGILPDGREIAVKRLSKTSGQGLEEFKNEVIFIAKLQHINLVRLLGCCIEEEEKLLMYEYMPNSSLDSHLFDKNTQKPLDWKLRLSIIHGIAKGLLYLHEDSRLKVIHRDLKTSNILLDYEMNPKISDFGMARTFGRCQNQAITKRIMGTYGYMAPEYAMEGLYSVKSDVFSFGVIILEIICGRRSTGFYLSEQGQSLLVYTWKLWCEGKPLELLDPSVRKSCLANEVTRCIHIGLLCVQEDAADRPTMSNVVLMLGSDSVVLRRPPTLHFQLEECP